VTHPSYCIDRLALASRAWAAFASVADTSPFATIAAVVSTNPDRSRPPSPTRPSIAASAATSSNLSFSVVDCDERWQLFSTFQRS
jgi:hypothetical protein